MGHARNRTATDHAGQPRRTRWVVLVVALAMLATACSSGSDPTATGDASSGPATTAAPTTAQPAGPSGAQELVVGVGEDPWIDSSESDQKRKPNYPLNADVCETMVHLGSDFTVEPMTTDVEFVGDNTFQFTLRDGVTFSDGTPVTSEDLKYSMDYTAQDPSTGFSFIGPDSTKIVDDRTIEVTPTETNLRLAEQINHPTYSVIKSGSDPLADINNLTCTGPFVVDSYAPGEELVVTKNDNYWGDDAAMLDKITFKFYPDDTTRALALQNNDVDMIKDVPLSILDSIEAQPDVKIARAPVGNTTLLYLGRRNADGEDRVLADPQVRRAVAASMNREAYVNGVLGGNAEIIPQVAPPAVLGEFADMVKGVPYDPEEAGRLLDEAGWTRQGDGVRMKDGKPLTVKIVYARLDLATPEFVQAQLADVGFDAQIAQLDAGAYRDTINNGDYDIDISVPNQNDGNPAFLMALRWYSKSTVPNAQIISPGPDTTYEKMIDAILKEEDPTALRRKSAEAMHELVDVEVGGVTLAGGYQVYAMKDKVGGFEAHPSGTNQRWASVFVQN